MIFIFITSLENYHMICCDKGILRYYDQKYLGAIVCLVRISLPNFQKSHDS
jgi:hypothetical protein